VEFCNYRKAVPLPSALIFDYTTSALVSLERQLALLLVLFGIMILGKTGHLRQSLFKTLLVAVVFVDL
jgi:hypothetical protein